MRFISESANSRVLERRAPSWRNQPCTDTDAPLMRLVPRHAFAFAITREQTFARQRGQSTNWRHVEFMLDMKLSILLLLSFIIGKTAGHGEDDPVVVHAAARNLQANVTSKASLAPSQRPSEHPSRLPSSAP
jgi:hypothetical protein